MAFWENISSSVLDVERDIFFVSGANRSAIGPSWSSFMLTTGVALGGGQITQGPRVGALELLASSYLAEIATAAIAS